MFGSHCRCWNDPPSSKVNYSVDSLNLEFSATVSQIYTGFSASGLERKNWLFKIKHKNKFLFCFQQKKKLVCAWNPVYRISDSTVDCSSACQMSATQTMTSSESFGQSTSFQKWMGISGIRYCSVFRFKHKSPCVAGWWRFPDVLHCQDVEADCLFREESFQWK